MTVKSFVFQFDQSIMDCHFEPLFYPYIEQKKGLNELTIFMKGLDLMN